MKLLRSPFRYKETCTNCKSDVSFKDTDIIDYASSITREVEFILTDEIKNAIIENNSNKEIINCLKSARKISLTYTVINPKIRCPYCGYRITVKTISGKINAVVQSYYLLDVFSKRIALVSDFSSIGIYILYNKKLIPEHLNL